MNHIQRNQKRDRQKPPATAGLNELDQERASSVADEGGASAATLEAQEPSAPLPARPPRSASVKPPARR